MPPVLIHSYLVYTREGVKYAVPCLKSSEATLLSHWLSLRGISSVAVPSGHAPTSVIDLPRDTEILFRAAQDVYDSGIKTIKVRKAQFLIRGTARRLIKPIVIQQTRYKYQEIRRPNNEPRDYRKTRSL